MVFLDLVLLVLISVCILYSFTLNRRIRDLQNSRSEFVKIAKYFEESVSKANNSVNELNKLTSSTTKDLSSVIDKAEILHNDLVFMQEIGGNMAERLEKDIDIARNTSGASRQDIHQNTSPQTASTEVMHDDISASHQILHKNKVYINSSSNNMQDTGDHTLDMLDYYSTLKKVNVKYEQ